jgi:hypothetical protein
MPNNGGLNLDWEEEEDNPWYGVAQSVIKLPVEVVFTAVRNSDLI